jgi:hypothetical protein
MLIDPKLYIGYEQALEVLEDISPIVKNIDWRNIADTLLEEQANDEGKDTWFVSRTEGSNRFFQSNRNPRESIPPEQDSASGDWVYLSLYDSTCNQVNHPLLESMFAAVIDQVKSLPGVCIIGAHYASKQTAISSHQDYTQPNWLNLVKVIQCGTNSSLIINDKSFKMYEGQLFVFDASIPHYVQNFDEKDFVVIVCRISKEFIIERSYENINT